MQRLLAVFAKEDSLNEREKQLKEKEQEIEDSSNTQKEQFRQQNMASAPSSQEMPDTIQKLIDQNQLLTQENAQLKQKYEEAEMAAYIVNNKEVMLPQLTERYRKSVPDGLMGAFGFQGTVVDYKVADIAYHTNTLFLTQELLWKLDDGSGEIAVINTGLDVDSETPVYLNLENTVPVKAEDLAKAMEVDSPVEKQVADSIVNQSPRTNKDINWKPSNETVNSAYQTGIKVAGAGLLMWLTDIVQAVLPPIPIDPVENNLSAIQNPTEHKGIKLTSSPNCPASATSPPPSTPAPPILASFEDGVRI